MSQKHEYGKWERCSIIKVRMWLQITGEGLESYAKKVKEIEYNKTSV